MFVCLCSKRPPPPPQQPFVLKLFSCMIAVSGRTELKKKLKLKRVNYVKSFVLGCIFTESLFFPSTWWMDGISGWIIEWKSSHTETTGHLVTIWFHSSPSLFPNAANHLLWQLESTLTIQARSLAGPLIQTSLQLSSRCCYLVCFWQSSFVGNATS